MNVLSIPVLNDDGSLEYHAQLTRNEVISLLQLAINVSASIGLGAWKKNRANEVEQRAEEAIPPQEFND